MMRQGGKKSLRNVVEKILTQIVMHRLELEWLFWVMCQQRHNSKKGYFVSSNAGVSGRDFGCS